MSAPKTQGVAKPAKAKRLTSYATREEQAARKFDTPLPYFRLEDSLCKGFLESATHPREFEGLKLLFPFVREMSLLKFSRDKTSLPVWMRLAFLAGHDLGAYPNRLEDVLPGLELCEAERRVRVIQNCSGEEHFSFGGLSRACDAIVEANWPEIPLDRLEAIFLDATLRTLKTGYAAATVSRFDPTRLDFLADMPERLGDCISDIADRFLVSAPRNAIGKPVVELLEHPLLKVAREMYPGKPIQCKVMLEFLSHQLKAMGVKSENDCPADELALLDWISGGIKYGAFLKEERPQLVQKIFEECKPENFEGARRVVGQIVAKAGGTGPGRLLPQLKLWQKSVYDLEDPKYFSDELAQVIYLSDFAVWIPWVISIEKEVH